MESRRTLTPFALSLRTVLQRKGWSMHDLAERMGFSMRTLRRVCYGDVELRVSFVEDVAHVLDVHPGSLVWPAPKNPDSKR